MACSCKRFQNYLVLGQGSSISRDRKRVMASVATSHTHGLLQSYFPPPWAQNLKYRPLRYAQLAMRPTPIHRWDLPGVPSGFQVSVKRDDLTGSTLTGNKVRKLEFLLADAIEKGCDSVITCGGAQSNHARATAVAARQLGLNPHLVLRWHGDLDANAVGVQGNLLLDRLSASRVILVPPVSYKGPGSLRMMEECAEKLRAEGSSAYIIPGGGSNEVGLWGYVEAFREMMEQSVLESFDDVIMPVGSGGTVGGIAIANYLTGSKLRIHAVCACDNAEYFYEHIDEYLELMGLTEGEGGEPLRARDLVDIIEGYVGLGFGQSTEEELAQLVDIVSSTGVAVDPVFTLKGVRGMLAEMEKNPERFAGKRVLFIHTGGIFGLYDGKIDSVLKKNPTTNRVSSFMDIDIH